MKGKISLQNLVVKDILAIFVVFYGFYLVSQGINGTVGTSLALIIAFYFSRWRQEK